MPLWVQVSWLWETSCGMLDPSGSYTPSVSYSSAEFRTLPNVWLWLSALAYNSFWMTPFWWQFSQAPICSQRITSSGTLYAITRSLSWSPPYRLLEYSPVPKFCTLMQQTLSPSPVSVPSPTWSLLFPFPPILSPFMKALLFPLRREIWESPMNSL